MGCQRVQVSACCVDGFPPELWGDLSDHVSDLVNSGECGRLFIHKWTELGECGHDFVQRWLLPFFRLPLRHVRGGERSNRHLEQHGCLFWYVRTLCLDATFTLLSCQQIGSLRQALVSCLCASAPVCTYLQCCDTCSHVCEFRLPRQLCKSAHQRSCCCLDHINWVYSRGMGVPTSISSLLSRLRVW